MRLATRATRVRTATLEKGVALGKEDHREPQGLGAREETRAKLDPQVNRDGKAPLVSPETRVKLAPPDLKDTEETRGPRGLRVPEAPKGQ